MKKSLLAPEAPPPSPPSPEPDSVLGMHHSNLKRLSEELHDLERLFAMWTDLSTQLSAAEAQIEGTVTELLSGTASDETFNAGSVRVASLSAQLTAIKKRTISSGTALQAKLQKDYIAPCEFLLGLWLDHRLTAERDQLLLTVPEPRRGSVTQHATALALVGLSYEQSQSELGPPASVSWLWQRPLQGVGDKNLSGVRGVVDPIWKSPDPAETLQALIDAGRAQQKRWQSLLIAVGLDPAFVPPTTYEEPKPEIWTPSKAEAGVISGPANPDIPLENPNQKRIHYTWEASDFVEKAG